MQHFNKGVFMRILLILLLITGCKTPYKPSPDAASPPYSIGYRSLEVESCGYRNLGTTACIVDRFTSLNDITLKVRVPNTNNQGRLAQLLIYSENCSLNEVFQVDSGNELVFNAKQLLGRELLTNNCVINIVATPQWNDQDKLTVATYPITGSIILLTSDSIPTSLTSDQFNPYPTRGALVYKSRPGIVDSWFVPNTGSSKAGRVIATGCMEKVVDYRESNPQITISSFPDSCYWLGKILRLDARPDLSFAVLFQKTPKEFTKLALPVIKEDKGKYVVFADPAVSSLEIAGQLYLSNKAVVDPISEFYIRQVTIIGRQALSYVKNGVVQWTLQ